MASTYVNNLRLNEMATGDQSGTWGTTTNTNLELIGQAFAWGTRAIANASTDNITIADGASDADRSMALKLTGGGQACTVTLLPNTSSKVWIMENATSYTLTFTQGSGANVAILAGETKMIATDGGGSGAVVYDVLTDLNLAGTTKAAALTVAGVGTFASLDISGDVDVDGTANLDVVDIDGAVDMASTLTVAGVVDITDTTDSSDATGDTGALRTEGGASIAKKLYVGTDLDVDGTANLDVVDIDGAVDMASTLQVDGAITNSSTIVSAGKITADAGIDIDNINIDGTTIGLSSGNLTLDVAGEINIDAGGGNITILDDGTGIAYFANSSSNFVIQSAVSDKDLLFKGNDGGSTITALTLDMSAAGAATFNNDVTAFSDERLKSNITTIPDALSKVSEMRGVHYVRDETGKDSSGVIAQELQKIAPELVLTAEDEMGTLSVNYGNITGYLIEAIKELKAEIEELKAR